MSDDLPVQDERIDADCPCACHELGVADTCLSVCCALARKDKQIAASHELIMRLTEKMERATSALLSRDMRLGIAHEALRHALPRVGMPVDHDTRAKWREEMLAAMSALSQPREPTPSPASTTTVWYPGTDATAMDLCPEHAIRLPCPACLPAASARGAGDGPDRHLVGRNASTRSSTSRQSRAPRAPHGRGVTIDESRWAAPPSAS